MAISTEAVRLVKQFEGLRLEPYLCPGGKWTIGYGHTGTRAREGAAAITPAEAEELLEADLEAVARQVERLVEVALRQEQFDALVCFAFNCGVGALSRSALLSKVNVGDLSGAAGEFGRWNRAGGRVLAGLTRRRTAERHLFESGGGPG